MSGHKPFKELKDKIRQKHIDGASELADMVIKEHEAYKHLMNDGPMYKLAKAYRALDQKYKELGNAFDSLHRNVTEGSCCDHEYHAEQVKGRDDV